MKIYCFQGFFPKRCSGEINHRSSPGQILLKGQFFHKGFMKNSAFMCHPMRQECFQ